MTNEHRVRDLCRQIRGIADVYPQGFAVIVKQVEALKWERWELPAVVTESVSGETQVAGEAGAQLSGRVAPEQTRRKRGRPRKHQVSE